MKKLLITLAFMTATVPTLQAQTEKRGNPFSISLEGGALISVNENYFSYRDNGQTAKLITPLAGLSLGYDFTHRLGARISASYGKNAGACNTEQTSREGFYPYTFSSVNFFADAVLNLGRSGSWFSPKLYIGIGGAHTFNFSDPGHPWQTLSDSNTAFGLRGGFIAQFDLSSRLGIFANLCAEAYNDIYNGLRPNEKDQGKASGYAGFPWDLRGIASLGVVFHF